MINMEYQRCQPVTCPKQIFLAPKQIFTSENRFQKKNYQILCDLNKCSENYEIAVYSNHNYDYSIALCMK